MAIWWRRAAYDRKIRVWSLSDRKLLSAFQGSDRVHRLAFSPDGLMVASGCDDGVVETWDIAGKRRKATFGGFGGVIRALAYSANGKSLAVGGDDGAVRLWNAETGGFEGALKSQVAAVSSLAFSPDGRTIASGCDNSTICLWDAETRNLLAVLKGHERPVDALAFSADGKTLCSGDDAIVSLWQTTELRQTRIIRLIPAASRRWSFPPDGKNFVATFLNKTVTVVDPRAKRIAAQFQGPAVLTASRHCAVFCPKTRVVCVGDSVGRVWVWSLRESTSFDEFRSERASGVLRFRSLRVSNGLLWATTIQNRRAARPELASAFGT